MTHPNFVYSFIISLIIVGIQSRQDKEDHGRIEVAIQKLATPGEILATTDAFMGGISCSHNLSKVYGTFRWNMVYPYVKDKINVKLSDYNDPEIPYPFPFALTIYNGLTDELLEPTVIINYDRMNLLYEVDLLDPDLHVEDLRKISKIQFQKKSDYQSVVKIPDLGPKSKLKILFTFLPDLNHDCNKILFINFEIKDRFSKISEVYKENITIIDVE